MSKNIVQMFVDEIAGYLKKIDELEKEVQDWQDGTIIAKWQDCEQKIKDLEKQLAEKETRIAELEDKDWYEGTIKQLEEQNERLMKERDSANDQNKRVLEKLGLLVRSNQDLEKQLAGKEQETKQLKRDLAMYKSVNEFINSYGIEKAKEVLLQSERTKKQDKTDFAIEQLEQMKETLEVLLENTEKELNSITDFEFHNKVHGSMKGYMDSINIIDQQIQELRRQR